MFIILIFMIPEFLDFHFGFKWTSPDSFYSKKSNSIYILSLSTITSKIYWYFPLNYKKSQILLLPISDKAEAKGGVL